MGFRAAWTLLGVAGCHSLDYDVVVYGSSPAGIAAATAAGHLGMSVAVFEPLKMIGGMGAAGNLALNDGGQKAERTGLALNFTLLNGQHYNLSGEVAHPESFVAEASFRSMLSNAKVKTIKTDCRLLSAQREQSNGVSKVQSVNLFCEENPITATVFIDASYDGDLMVAIGDVEYTAGREAISKYNESLAGARTPGFHGVHGPQHVNALRDDGSILKYVANMSELAAPGEADDALMAFQHRMCISGEEDRVPWPKPAGYNADDFLLMQRALEAYNNNSGFFSHMPPSRLPGLPKHIKKYCLCCGITVGSSDQPMLNKGWASASWERRQEIIADHTYFELGSFYYFANDPKVPQEVRDTFGKYGLCRDEFQDNDYIPPQLYVRISNRMVGDYVMTQNNIATPRNKDDSIAVADWSLDEHMTGKYAVPQTDGTYEVQLEGNFWPSVKDGKNWYDVPYKIMVAKRGTGSNLLVPVALSASAVAYSSTRIENMFMSVGSAAGVAAKQLVDGSAPTVQDVDVGAVQKILTERFQQRIHGPPGNAPTPSPSALHDGDVVVMPCNATDKLQQWGLVNSQLQLMGVSPPQCLSFDQSRAALGGHGQAVVVAPCDGNHTQWDWTDLLIRINESAPKCVNYPGNCDCVNVVSEQKSVEMWSCGSNGGEERFTFDDKSGLISTPAGECIAPGRFSLSPSAACTTLEIAGSTAGHNGRYLRVSGLRDGVGVWRRSDDHEIYRSGGVWRIAHYGVEVFYTAPSKDQTTPPQGHWSADDAHSVSVNCMDTNLMV